MAGRVHSPEFNEPCRGAEAGDRPSSLADMKQGAVVRPNLQACTVELSRRLLPAPERLKEAPQYPGGR